jgi:hypothetical protein
MKERKKRKERKKEKRRKAPTEWVVREASTGSRRQGERTHTVVEDDQQTNSAKAAVGGRGRERKAAEMAAAVGHNGGGDSQGQRRPEICRARTGNQWRCCRLAGWTRGGRSTERAARLTVKTTSARASIVRWPREKQNFQRSVEWRLK